MYIPIRHIIIMKKMAANAVFIKLCGFCKWQTREVEETLPDEYIVLGASIMTYNGVRYTKISDEALVDTIASPGAYAVNIADGKYYNLSFDYTDGVITRITVCNENGSCIGTFEYNG